MKLHFPEIEQVLVDNIKYPYNKISKDTLSINIKIPKDQTRYIKVKYKNSFSNDLSKYFKE